MDKLSFLRSTFNSVAEDYAAIRPGYPDGLIEDVITFAALQPGARCLEVGCGTGQATLPFARRGCHILCLDIGAELLVRAVENLSPYTQVRFQQIPFEDWPLEPELFDLLFSATAFHWVPPEIGYPKAAQVLRPGGTLALFWTTHAPQKEGFFIEVDDLYRRYDPAWVEPEKRRSIAQDEQVIRERIGSTGLFGPVEVRHYPAPRILTTTEYLQLINTFSDHLALPEDNRRSLYDGIADLIDSHYGGRIVKHTQVDLYLAHKESSH